MNSDDREWMSHEVPTHVDSKDKVFLGLTFFQIVVFILVSTLAYVFYQSAIAQTLGILLRYGLPLVFWAVGAAWVLVEIGGRGLVSVVWDLASHMMGGNRYEGSSASFLDTAPENVEAAAGKEYRAPHEKLLDFILRKRILENE